MERVDFYSVMKVIRDNYKSGYEPMQISLVGDLFCTYRDETGTEFEGTQACRWLSGQMPVSSNVGLYYTLDKKKKRSLVIDILEYVIPDLHDIEKTGEELKDLVVQDTSISESKKQGIIFENRLTTGEELAEYIATLILFTLERPFVKRDKKTKELLVNGTLSPAVMDYIYMEEIPEPCKHFTGRDKELAELGTMLENEKKVFLRGIAGIGKSELVRDYIKENKKKYTNIICISYSGSLYKDIAGLDFADDRFDEDEQARFKRHNRFLRSLKEDTLIVIDGFDTLPHEDELFSVIYKYRCRIIFTTRSLFEGYPSLELSEIDDIEMLMGLVAYFYKDASEYRDTILEIIETVHRHTLAVELAARLLSRGILEPDELLDRLKNENVKLQASDKLDLNKDGVPTKDTYYGHIHTLFSIYKLNGMQISMMRCLTLVQPSGISVKVFVHWMGAADMNDIRDLIDAGFVKEESANHICLHPMIRDIATADTEPAVSSCRAFLDNIEADMNEFEEVSYFHMLLAVMREILDRIEADDAVRFYGFLSSCFLKYGEYRYPDEQWEILNRMEEIMTEDDFSDAAMRTTLLSYQGHKKEREGALDDAMKLKMEALDIVKDDPDELSGFSFYAISMQNHVNVFLLVSD